MIPAHLHGLYQLLGINWLFGGPAQTCPDFCSGSKAPRRALVASNPPALLRETARGKKVGPAQAVPAQVTQGLWSRQTLGKFHKVVKKKTKRNAELRASSKKPLRKHTEEALDRYFASLNGDRPGDLYELVLGEVEQPLFKAVMEYTQGNQSQAAGILGINRGTLRKKLKCYSLIR